VNLVVRSGYSSPSYSPLVVDHFDAPRNHGHFESAPGVIAASAGRSDQGATFYLSAQVLDGVIKAVRFESYGCPHCIAAASWLTERLTGATLEDLQHWDWRDAAKALDVPPEKAGRLLILEDAVKRLAEAWRTRP
jgi:nitrogen fixation NifU-like protein